MRYQMQNRSHSPDPLSDRARSRPCVSPGKFCSAATYGPSHCRIEVQPLSFSRKNSSHAPIGSEVGVTRERVRQIQMKTLNLLREQRRTQNLREYLR